MLAIKKISWTMVASALLLSAAVDARQTVPSPRTRVADISTKSLDDDYAAERANRPEKRKAPLMGLSLSGGGTKAAMFSHGVLHGLQNKEVLQQVDAISSVSGGSYVAYWYFTKMIEAKRNKFELANIFADCIPAHWTKHGKNDSQLDRAMDLAVAQGPMSPQRYEKCPDSNHWNGPEDTLRWQAHLVRWPDVMQDRPSELSDLDPSIPKKQIAYGVLRELARMGRLNLKNDSLVPRLYQYGIERTWGLNPLARIEGFKKKKDESDKWKYTNVAPAGHSARLQRVNAQTSTWMDLRALYDGAATAPGSNFLMPLWIANTTMANKSDAATNTRHIFELTPFGFGADGDEAHLFGYVNNVAESPVQNLGESVRASAAVADTQGVRLHKLRPWVDEIVKYVPPARWGVPVKVTDAAGKRHDLRLSDGGGSENLGLYSLLKRDVKEIVVVDAASDVEGNMGNICAVRKALAADGIKLAFPALRDLELVCKGKALRYNVSAWLNPVVRGTVTWPVVEGEPRRVSQIYLVKAAWNERAVLRAYNEETCGQPGQPSCFLTVFYGHNSLVKLKKSKGNQGDMAFPQLSTFKVTVNSSRNLFWGFRELGRDAVKDLSLDENGHLSLAGEQCKQFALERRKGLRPHKPSILATERPAPGGGCEPVELETRG